MPLTKDDLKKEVEESLESSRAFADEFVDLLFEELREGLLRDDHVVLVGFGRFRLRSTAKGKIQPMITLNARMKEKVLGEKEKLGRRGPYNWKKRKVEPQKNPYLNGKGDAFFEELDARGDIPRPELR